MLRRCFLAFSMSTYSVGSINRIGWWCAHRGRDKGLNSGSYFLKLGRWRDLCPEWRASEVASELLHTQPCHKVALFLRNPPAPLPNTALFEEPPHLKLSSQWWKWKWSGRRRECAEGLPGYLTIFITFFPNQDPEFIRCFLLLYLALGWRYSFSTPWQQMK